MPVLLVFLNISSESFNNEFRSYLSVKSVYISLYQSLLAHYFSFYLVAELFIYIVLHIYRIILTLLCSMIFATARICWQNVYWRLCPELKLTSLLEMATAVSAGVSAIVVKCLNNVELEQG